MRLIEQNWWYGGVISWLLWPVSVVYGTLMYLRRLYYQRTKANADELPVPVVVIGNLAVGGAGKTPLCAALVNHFKTQGWKPAIVSRGYGGTARTIPYVLTGNEHPSDVGDEPLMLSQQTGVPVCVCIARQSAVDCVVKLPGIDIVFSDDGLQHLAMHRSAEILVIDSQRGFGNQWVLPAGPLREFPGTVSAIEFVAIQSTPAQPSFHHSIINSRIQYLNAAALENQFQLNIHQFYAIHTDQVYPVSFFNGRTVHAVSGIGNPQRFFQQLNHMGLSIVPHAFPDHHVFTESDLKFNDGAEIIVTSKDAIKIKALNLDAAVFEAKVTIDMSASLLQAVSDLEYKLRDQLQ